ncbi:MAG: methyltransferase [Candidatus Altiarchaeales archaeon]|nr:methyltransferase [Candidatus Altiarchaeales archaeon]
MRLDLIVGSLLSSVAVLATPSYYLGMVIPYAIKLTLQELGKAGKVSGSLYAISTAGSILGTFLAGFFLIPYFKVTTVIYFIGLLLGFGSLYLAGGRMIYDFMTVLVVAILLFYFMPSYSVEAFSTGGAVLLFERDTQYNLLMVKDLADGGRIMQIGNVVEGGVNMSSGRSLSRYTEHVHFSWLLSPEIHRVLFLGCGAGVMPSGILRNYPQVQVDVVDIDGEVFKAAEVFFNLSESERMRFHVNDARMFVKNSEGKYDLIVMDVFSSTHAVPFHLTTREMVVELERHLNDDGVLFFNVISSINGSQSLFFRSVYKTVGSVFPTVYVLPVKKNASVMNNIILIATKSNRKYSREEFVSKVDSLNASEEIRGYLDYSVDMLWDEGVELSDAVELSDEYAPVDYVLSQV